MKWLRDVRRNISWHDLECVHEKWALEVQENPELGILLVSEPMPTFTFGRSAGPEDRIWTDDIVRARGIEIHRVSRGGKWTYHGPGQILVYPIVRLRSLGYDVRAVSHFLEALREGTSAFLRNQGLRLETRTDRPFGIYASKGKIVSFGISVEKGICRHGLALYLTDQALNFQGIHPCGVKGEKLTSLEELGAKLKWDEAASSLTSHIEKCFQC